MKELMLRLIKDGKIVGYILIENDFYFSRTGNKMSWDALRFIEPRDYEHDSFDMGIKVGDEWWFSGDRIQICGKSIWILRYNTITGWYYEMPETVKPAYPDGKPFVYNELSMKRIGNIYEGDE